MSYENKQKVVLIHAAPENVINLFNIDTCIELDSWIYLGKNVKLFSEIDTIIGGRIKKINTGEILQDAAHYLRKPYIDFVGKIGQEENKKAWILSSISEKNIYMSDLFLKLCYLEVLDYVTKNYIGGICVFCEDPVLIRNIQKNFENNTDLKVQEEIKNFYIRLKTILKSFLKKYRFIKAKLSLIYCFIIKMFYARILQIRKISEQNISNNEPVIVIHSWTDQRSFVNEGSFSDPYYGVLGKLLEDNRINMFYMIDVLWTISYPETLKKISKLKFQNRILENFLMFSDIIRAYQLAQIRKTREIINIFFRGHEISDLINEEYTNDRYSNRAELSSLYFFAARRMAQQFPIKTFLYTFENHIWEKMIIEGIREISPHTKIVGYAHATVNTMNLCYSRSAIEKNIIPIPDNIVVNGKQAKDLLLESGFEDANIQIIGSLRYGDLTFIKKSKKSPKKPEVLVVLSCNFDKSLEMIFKCMNAFRYMDDLSITFKTHPIVNNEILMRSIGRFPKIFSFSSKSINELFDKTDLVIYSDSTASVEAASLGIPLLHIKSDLTIDMNIFEDVKIIPSVCSPHQIRIQSLKILGGEYPTFNEIQTYVKQIFSPVDEQTILDNIT